jgi:UDP-N-acetylmuramoyl-L-alanyl-D-glutamate--2,6-diaminopimelate ligase
MLDFLRKIIPQRHPIRLWYHKIQAMAAAIFFQFPANKLHIIGVTGTSGKSSTVNLIHHLIQGSGVKCGALSTINFFIGEKEVPNASLRTTMRPWQTQKWLRKIVWEGCEYAVIEVSSHALDQNRLWGVSIDTAVLTNIYGQEHLDYHGNFAEYVRTKTKLFQSLNRSHRKSNIPKISVLNRDDENFEIFEDIPSDRLWTYSRKKNADIQAQDLDLSPKASAFHLKMPNESWAVKVPLVGQHNVENLIAAITAVTANGIPVQKIEEILKTFPAIPGRLEPVDKGQNFSVLVDFSYKPSALKAVGKTLLQITGSGRLIVVFGGAYGRTEENLKSCGKILRDFADEIILTTDDPHQDDPKRLAKAIRAGIEREEGQRFFEIEDRYEAIRYALYTAEKGDCVLIAGRGHEKVQVIGNQKIPFDDRAVAREILQFAQKEKIIEKQSDHK